MRILFVTAHRYLPEVKGGMEVNTHQLAVALRTLGHAVGVLAGLKGTGYVGLSARARMKLLRNPSPVDRTLGYPTWRAWDSLTVAKGVTDLFRPDVVVLQGGHNFLELLRTLLDLGVPVVGYLHSADRLPLDEDLQRRSHLTFVANSKYTASLHPEKPMGGIVPPIIPRDAYATDTDRSAAVFVNPAPYKGLDTVMALARARPDIPFLFVDNGMPTRPPHSDLLPPNVRLVGPFDDMKKVYAKAKVVLAPSKWNETWGRIASEAHISGIPVLATSRGGLPESVGTGGLCIPADAPVEEWVVALGKIWDDPKTYQELQNAALQYSMRTEIQPETIVKSLEQILKKTIAVQ